MTPQQTRPATSEPARRLTDLQRAQLAKFFEAENGGTDIGGTDSAGPQSGEVDWGNDETLKGILAELFSEDAALRSNAYGEARRHLAELKTDAQRINAVELMLKWTEQDLFNIKGRSNVLSLLATAPDAVIAANRGALRQRIKEVRQLGQQSPAYAVGPQTTGWLTRIEQRLTE